MYQQHITIYFFFFLMIAYIPLHLSLHYFCDFEYKAIEQEPSSDKEKQD